MTTLKNEIKIIPPLPNKIKKKISPIKILITLILIIIFFIAIYFIYNTVTPYINAIKINKIIGKKTFITECNTKDYIIINLDKSYSMKLTNDDCETTNYEGNIIIKNNEIYFKYKETINKNNKEKTINKKIKGTIDTKNYNIIINNNEFESEKNE